MVRAIILVKSPKKLIAVKLRKLTTVANSFPTSGLRGNKGSCKSNSKN